MVPPPDTMGEFPDFDSMTPEEQMAWLESLAKRQGVGDEELTTSANMEIAEVSADTVIDEPGYVPFEGSRSARRMKEEAEAAARVPSPEPEIEPEPEFEPELELEPEPEMELEPELDWELEPETLPDWEFETLEEGVEDIADLVDAMASEGDAADPMQWLDGLSAEPDADIGDLDELFADSDLADSESVWEDNAVLEPLESFAAEEELALDAAASDDDPLGGMDPVLFLESLARRQGANLNELTTSADMEVEEVSADTVIDEPGYVPFEGSRSARRMKEDAEAAAQAPPPESEPEPAISMAAESAADSLDELSDDDEMEWLESLGKRQGADEEELITAAAFDIPELPEDTIIDEPGYVEYDLLSILPADREIELPADALVAAEDDDDLFELESSDDSLSWLEDLAAEPDEEFSDMFAEFEETVSEPELELESEPEPEPAAASVQASDDPLAGLSDEDVARLQAQGELTPHQELAWLKRQAAKLAEVHHEMDEAELSDEELAPAEPADLPPWLAQMREEDEGESAAILAESLDTAGETELRAGLFEEIEADIALDMSSLALDTDELSPAEVDSLWAEPIEEELDLEDRPESELTAYLEGELEPEADPLAEALDAEYERKMVGDESEPDWYTDAVAKVASEAPSVPEDWEPAEPSAAPEAPPEPVVSAAVPVEMPDWLKEVQQEAAPVEAPIPDWLQGEDEIEPAIAGDIPDWLQEQMPTAEGEAIIPDWLSEMGEEELLEEAALDWIPDGVADTDEAEPELEPFAEVEPEPIPEPVAEVEPESVSEPARELPPAPVSLPEAVPAARVEPEVTAPAPAAVPQGARYDQYRQRLAANPDDHASRLELARALRDQRQTTPSLDHYETLIHASQRLQDVVNDLRRLVEAEAGPRVNRLLGDAFMRQGRLQEALESYRSALNKL